HVASVAPRLMPVIVASLRDTHAGMMLTLHEASLIELLAALRSGRIHIALIHTNPDLPLAMGGLDSATIATGPRMLVMRPDNPLARWPPARGWSIRRPRATRSSSHPATATPGPARERKGPVAATASSRVRQRRRTTPP